MEKEGVKDSEVQGRKQKAVCASKKTQGKKPEAPNKPIQPSLDAQARLAEILSDSPRKVSLNGTEWEIKALRMGTQWLICDRVSKVIKKRGETIVDMFQDIATDIPLVLEVIALALLNDKNKIFKGGDNALGYSDLFKSTYDTLQWECPVGDFANLLLDILEMIDVNFLQEAAATLQMLTASVTNRKREMTKGLK